MAKTELEKAHQGILDYYNSLGEHQLAFYHRVPRERIRKWKSGEMGPPLASECHRDVIHIGALGSGKSVGGLYTAIALSVFIPDNFGIIVRKRWEELRNHVVDELYRLADDITGGRSEALLGKPKIVGGSYEIVVQTADPKRPSRIIIKPEPDGTDRAIEDSFKGPEFGWFLLDEATSLREATWRALLGRLRRKFPGKSDAENAALRAGLAMTNPPFAGNWIHDNVALPYDTMRAQEELTRRDTLVIRSTMEDNLHLDDDYIANVKHQFRNDPIRYRMYVLGEDGINIEGRPVFGDAFQSKFHLDKLKLNPHLPLIVGMDFGWHHPAAVFLQKTPEGYINVLGEILGNEMTAEEFGKAVLDYISANYPNARQVEYYGDPAGAQQTDKGDPTIVIMAKMGIRIGFRKMEINPGLDLIRDLLGTMRQHRPRLVFDDSNCPILVKAMIGGYHYKQARTGMVKPMPNKDGFYDHLVDAFRYALTNICGVYGQDTYNKNQEMPTKIPGMSPKRTIFDG